MLALDTGQQADGLLLDFMIKSLQCHRMYIKQPYLNYFKITSFVPNS